MVRTTLRELGWCVAVDEDVGGAALVVDDVVWLEWVDDTPSGSRLEGSGSRPCTERLRSVSPRLVVAASSQSELEEVGTGLGKKAADRAESWLMTGSNGLGSGGGVGVAALAASSLLLHPLLAPPPLFELRCHGVELDLLIP